MIVIPVSTLITTVLRTFGMFRIILGLCVECFSQFGCCAFRAPSFCAIEHSVHCWVVCIECFTWELLYTFGRNALRVTRMPRTLYTTISVQPNCIGQFSTTGITCPEHFRYMSRAMDPFECFMDSLPHPVELPRALRDPRLRSCSSLFARFWHDCPTSQPPCFQTGPPTKSKSCG